MTVFWCNRKTGVCDEELADILTMMTSSFICLECQENNGWRCNAKCEKNCLDWLKQPVKDGEGDG